MGIATLSVATHCITINASVLSVRQWIVSISSGAAGGQWQHAVATVDCSANSIEMPRVQIIDTGK